MPVEPGVLDANIPAYAFNADAPQQRASRALIESARSPATTLYVTSQILCEFYSVVTNTRRVASACRPHEAIRFISVLVALPGLQVLSIDAGAVTACIELLERRPVSGADVFDLQIVATMQANGVRRIYTYNSTDFRVFPELIVVVP